MTLVIQLFACTLCVRWLDLLVSLSALALTHIHIQPLLLSYYWFCSMTKRNWIQEGVHHWCWPCDFATCNRSKYYWQPNAMLMPNMTAGRVSDAAGGLHSPHKWWNQINASQFRTISVVQEAVCTGDATILTAILEVRDLQRHIQRVTHVPKLLQKLVDAPDFYVEMKWEFTSWGKCLRQWCRRTIKRHTLTMTSSFQFR